LSRELLSAWGERMKRKRKLPILGHVYDVFGNLWEVLEVRETQHGFDLLFGEPTHRIGYEVVGHPSLIGTQELADFWRRNRIAQKSVRYDLPVGTRTISRIRKLLGFNYSRDVTEFWKSHLDELATLDAREFAMKYGVGRCHVLGMRKDLVGGRQRGRRWWRTPETIAIIQSDIKPQEVSQKLGISLREVYRIRRVLRSEAQEAA
jgi:hypothetical protein